MLVYVKRNGEDWVSKDGISIYKIWSVKVQIGLANVIA